jgi:hypothetical protein
MHNSLPIYLSIHLSIYLPPSIYLQEGCPPALLVYSWTATCLLLCGFFLSILIYPVIQHTTRPFSPDPYPDSLLYP